MKFSYQVECLFAALTKIRYCFHHHYTLSAGLDSTIFVFFFMNARYMDFQLSILQKSYQDLKKLRY